MLSVTEGQNSRHITNMYYGTGQRVAFAGLVIGFLLCLSGAIAPYWLYGKLDVNTITEIGGEKIHFIGDLKLADMNEGLWWYCYSVLDQTQCRAQDILAEGWYIRLPCAVNVLLTLLCALTALCRTCCCEGGKTICHGIIAFIAGAAGIAAIGLFAHDSSETFGMKLSLVEYGWAFFIYIAGSAIVTLVSFLLCFASPNNPMTGMIISSVGGVLPINRYSRMADDRVPLGEAGGDMQQGVNYYPRA